MGVVMFLELGAINAFCEAEIIWKNESSPDNSFSGKSSSNYFPKTQIETDRWTHIRMANNIFT